MGMSLGISVTMREYLGDRRAIQLTGTVGVEDGFADRKERSEFTGLPRGR